MKPTQQYIDTMEIFKQVSSWGAYTSANVEISTEGHKRDIWVFLDTKTYAWANGDFFDNPSHFQAIHSYRKLLFNWTYEELLNIISSVKYINTSTT